MKGTLISILVGALGGMLLTVGSAAVHASHDAAAHRAAQAAASGDAAGNTPMRRRIRTCRGGLGPGDAPREAAAGARAERRMRHA